MSAGGVGSHARELARHSALDSVCACVQCGYFCASVALTSVLGARAVPLASRDWSRPPSNALSSKPSGEKAFDRTPSSTGRVFEIPQTLAKMKKDPGCSKCRYAARGCRRCVVGFVTASEARLAKQAAAEAREAKKAGNGRKKDDDAETSEKASSAMKRPRGRPVGSKNAGKTDTKLSSEKKRESGTFPKTPSTANVEDRAQNRAPFVSPPSISKTAGAGQTTAQKANAARDAITNAGNDEHDESLNDSFELPGKAVKKVRWGVMDVDGDVNTGAAVQRTTTTVTTTTTTTTVPLGTASDDDMNALATKLAQYVGSYGNLDARDLLGVPCGGQLLCEALARVAGV